MFSISRSWVGAIVALSMFSFVAAGCGGDDDGTADDAPDAMLPGADAAPADGGAPDAPRGDLLVRLNAIPGLHATEPPPPTSPAPPLPDGYRFFLVDFDQPVDHAHPEGQHFTQRFRLMHHDEHAPMIQHTGGYGVSSRPFRHELTKMTTGNQITVEHRYFDPSIPTDPTNWSYLTIEQSAADFHAINQALRTIYDGKWVSTGESKGGMTSIFNRRFYPDDVDATVAYVAPIMTAGDDPRFQPFIDHVGGDAQAACRAGLVAFQRAALTHKADILPLAEADASANGLTYDLLGEDQAFEHAILELPFAFWQYGDASMCADIPADGATAQQLYDFMEEVNGIENVSDPYVQYFTPYYYQAGTQFGWPGCAEPAIADLMQFGNTDVPATYATSTGATLTYDPHSMVDILDWLSTSGERIIFVYGENDPWSAAMADFGNAQDTYRYIQPAGNHGSKITTLADADRTAAMTELSGWLGVTLTLPAQKLGQAPEPDMPVVRTPL
jgi:hypothetical protein